ncbi:MAG: DnaK suppressor protein [Desulfovibrionales bacterium]|jgi:DnaK suppressor protein|nr:DnaK suppressor protein [Desulfovibrionales bacterium]
MTESQRQEIKRHLESRLEELSLKSTDGMDRVENCADEVEYATRMAEHSLNVMLRERESAQVNQIRKALKRLDSLDFGVCEECGDDIGLARLKAQPTSRLCVDCQAALESRPLAYAC